MLTPDAFRQPPEPGTLVRAYLPSDPEGWVYGQIVDPTCPPDVSKKFDFTRDRPKRDEAVVVHWRAREGVGAWERVTFISLDGIEPANPIDMMAALEPR